jgi:hypothetical protein
MSSGHFDRSSGSSSSADCEFLFEEASCRRAKVDRSTDDRCPWSRTLWDGYVNAKLRERSWYEYHHMPVDVFNKLHALLFKDTAEELDMKKRKGLNSTPMGSIDSRVMLASTMRQLFGEKSKSMVDVFKISPTSCRAGFKDIIARINACSELSPDLYNTDHSIATLQQRAFAFARRSFYPNHFRHAVGAIDGLFIKTEQPTRQDVGNVRTYYSGHKRAFGLNMQGVCDAQCRFIGFACCTPGSTNDYVAFRHSFCYAHWPSLPEPFYYLGDCAYPLSPQCITPYIGTSLPHDADAFNFYHSQLRITIERTFGIFVNVFSIFHTPLKFPIATCCEVVEACVRLHNFRIDSGCQIVARKRSNAAVYREAYDRSNEAFDVLDDIRYTTDRPHPHDTAYGNYVRNAEIHSGIAPSNAARGSGKRDVLTQALAMVGAARPAANSF